MPEIQLEGVSKRFGAMGEDQPEPRSRQGSGSSTPALDGVTLSVEKGEILVIVGPSGCGKSTALRIVAGLEQPDGGTVTIGGRPMASVPPQERDVAMVFQGYALYPQMTARQILEFPLKMRRVPSAQRAMAVRETAQLLRIEPLLDRRPSQMSGGERQRVAMGRAMVRKPRVFLFDEPLSNLDAALRADLRLEIGQLVRKAAATALYVTHDQVEAMTLADRIAVLRAGRLLQVGTPREIYKRPATSFVGAFLGSPRLNLLDGHIDTDGRAIRVGTLRLPLPRTASSLPGAAAYDRVVVGVRPEHVRVEEHGEAGAGERAAIVEPGQVLDLEPLGADTHLVLRVGGQILRAVVRGFALWRRGDAVRVGVDPADLMFFDAEGEGARLEL